MVVGSRDWEKSSERRNLLHREWGAMTGVKSDSDLIRSPFQVEVERNLVALKSVRKQLQVAWVKDGGCLKLGECRLLSRHLLLNDHACVYIYIQILYVPF